MSTERQVLRQHFILEQLILEILVVHEGTNRILLSCPSFISFAIMARPGMFEAMTMNPQIVDENAPPFCQTKANWSSCLANQGLWRERESVHEPMTIIERCGDG